MRGAERRAAREDGHLRHGHRARAEERGGGVAGLVVGRGAQEVGVEAEVAARTTERERCDGVAQVGSGELGAAAFDGFGGGGVNDVVDVGAFVFGWVGFAKFTLFFI